MPDADKELMEAALRQLGGKMDYAKLANDLNMSSSKSAWQRWSRFKTKLNKTTPGSPTITDQAIKSPQTTKVKTPNSKRKASKSGTPAKRRKFASSEDQGDDDLNPEIKTENDTSTPPVFETPTRRLPAHKSRVTAFKEESEAELSDYDFADSGHGGSTPTAASDAGVTHSEDEA